MKYLVHTVAADELPEGVERVIVERDEGQPPLLIISGEAARCWQFMRTWEDSIEPDWLPSVILPMMRAAG